LATPDARSAASTLGHGLAGQGREVEHRNILADTAVHRQDLALADQQPVAGLEDADVDFLQGLAVEAQAVRATRPSGAVISFRARPWAKSSRICPPAYIRATTLPANGCPNARAAAIDSAATTSSPTSPRSKEATIWTSKPARTATAIRSSS